MLEVQEESDGCIMTVNKILEQSGVSPGKNCRYSKDKGQKYPWLSKEIVVFKCAKLKRKSTKEAGKTLKTNQGASRGHFYILNTGVIFRRRLSATLPRVGCTAHFDSMSPDCPIVLLKASANLSLYYI
ncbi:hypothetical protein J6590_038362 [Homalodisca vitripennis]|nr:hypothetical protein J6590_038362 [Homalodisca vitripennis]